LIPAFSHSATIQDVAKLPDVHTALLQKSEPDRQEVTAHKVGRGIEGKIQLKRSCELLKRQAGPEICFGVQITDSLEQLLLVSFEHKKICESGFAKFLSWKIFLGKLQIMVFKKRQRSS
jgi:hypothetical protein